MLSVEGLPTAGDTVTIPAVELSAMKKDLEVTAPSLQNTDLVLPATDP